MSELPGPPIQWVHFPRIITALNPDRYPTIHKWLADCVGDNTTKPFTPFSSVIKTIKVMESVVPGYFTADKPIQLGLVWKFPLCSICKKPPRVYHHPFLDGKHTQLWAICDSCENRNWLRDIHSPKVTPRKGRRK